MRAGAPADTPDDPGGLIRQVLDMGPEFPGPAEDVLLSWMLRLDEGTQAPAAARRLLAAYRLAEGPPPADPRGRLIALLRETAASTPAERGRRRGGARGRRR